MTACWWWRCSECGQLTVNPHTGPDNEDLCPECCVPCTTGATLAAQDQWTKENKTSLNPGDPMPYHGLPSREQMAAAETGDP